LKVVIPRHVAPHRPLRIHAPGRGSADEYNPPQV
jgi:hypothetical protein